MASPPLGRASVQTQRELRSRFSQFAQMGPDVLRRTLDDAARGDFEKWADLADQMYNEDDHIRSTWDTRISAVGAARYVIEAGGDGPLDEAFARYCKDVLRHMKPEADAWESLDDVNLALRLLDAGRIGFSVCEMKWSPVLRPLGSLMPGDWTVSTAYWIHQRRFIFGDDWKLRLRDTGRIQSGEGFSLDPDRYLVHIPQSVGGYPTQNAVFRSIAFPYLYKRWGQQWWMDGMERFSWPTPIAELNEFATDDARESAVDMLDEHTQGKNICMPVGSTIRYLETGVKDGGTWNAYVKRQNEAISKGILGVSDVTEPGKVGAWKAVESRTGSTVHPRMSLDQSCLASTYQVQLFTPLRKYNPRFAGAAIPKIRWLVSSEQTSIPRELIEARAVTVNELRAAAKLPPIPGGDRIAEIGGSAEPSAPQPAAEPEPATPSPPEAQEAPGGITAAVPS